MTEQRDRLSAQDAHRTAAVRSPETRGARRPYVAPRIESGDVFERVQLASGCNEGTIDCPIPC